MNQCINRVVRANLPWAPQLRMITVHRREVPDLAEAEWIRFACENVSDPTVVAVMAQDPQLKAVVEAHQAKQKGRQPKQETDVAQK
jgi:hypothetical protein